MGYTVYEISVCFRANSCLCECILYIDEEYHRIFDYSGFNQEYELLYKLIFSTR